MHVYIFLLLNINLLIPQIIKLSNSFHEVFIYASKPLLHIFVKVLKSLVENI